MQVTYCDFCEKDISRIKFKKFNQDERFGYTGITMQQVSIPISKQSDAVPLDLCIDCTVKMERFIEVKGNIPLMEGGEDENNEG